MKITRRNFIVGGLASAALTGCGKSSSTFSADWHGPNFKIGHAIRDKKLPPVTDNQTIDTLIVGGGISGLSCAWWLERNQYQHFKLFELESQLGGNARSGRNHIGAFPWGAHYLPLPGRDAIYVRELLRELNVLTSGLEADAPEYDERYLVQAPDERLFIHGGWQDGLLPRVGVGRPALDELARFEQLMVQWASMKGRDNKLVFTIPSAMGTRDTAFDYLDSLNFKSWLQQQGFHSAALDWYIGYSLRDDFGMDQNHVSAWAGLHYFCCRHGQAKNAEPQAVLTSPSGNGWVVERLRERLKDKCETQAAVIRLVVEDNHSVVDVYHADRQKTVRYHCQRLVWSAPLNLLANAWVNAPALIKPNYAPWLVVNLSIDSPDPQEFSTWDNVIYQGQGLGYVDASHQLMQYRKPQRVLTYYHAINQADTQAARKMLIDERSAFWEAQIFDDLSPAHPALKSQVKALDFWRWPHAMSYPEVGFRQRIRQYQSLSQSHFHIAHSDLSGYSLFEEAQYWGVEAARRLLDK